MAKKHKVSVEQKELARAAQATAENQLSLAKRLEERLELAIKDNSEDDIKALSMALREQLKLLDGAAEEVEKIVKRNIR